MDLFQLSYYGPNGYALPPLFVGVAIALLGVVVLLREQWSPVSMAFFGMTSAGAVWLLGSAGCYLTRDPWVALQWARMENCGVAFIPSMVFLFALYVAGKLRRFRALALASVLISFLFCFSILFTPAFVPRVKLFPWGYFPQYGPLSIPFLAFFSALLAASLLIYRREYRRAPEGIGKRRLGAFLTAFGISYLGSVDFLTTFGLPVYPFGYLPVLLFLGITARALWRYHLLDITPAFAAAQILRTVSDALLVFDQEGVVRVANQAACDLFEQSEDQLTGQPIWRVDGGFFPQERFDAFMRTRVIHSYETVRLSSRGKKTVLDVAVSGIRDEFGEPAAVVCVARDLTQRKLAEEELRRVHEALKRSHQELKSAQMQLVEAAKMESVGRLAAGIAHEVKNPLAVILQGLDYLDGRLEASDDISMVMKEGKNAVRRADTVLRGLLDFSALRSLELSETSLNAVIEEALLLVKYPLDAAHVHVIRQLDENLPLLPLDRNKMEQVFVNLFINAVHAMVGSGTLSIRTARGPGHRVVVEVEDTGTGIPPEILSKVFDPFFTTKPAGKGTGLGLTVAKSLVELQGGSLRIGNRPEGGVKAVLTFRETKGNSTQREKENPAD